MRIAIPVVSGEVFSPLANAEAFHFYEDDHGKIVREFLEPMEESGTDAAVGLLEHYGIIELVRSGAVAVTRGPKALSEKVLGSEITGR